ncbi:MAG: hypothetical protein CR997_02680 [Acidobacteria bacterium]|nr:MAG: hypothetical protein CR997_02680 [Acidobacteriota bacterium]
MNHNNHLKTLVYLSFASYFLGIAMMQLMVFLLFLTGIYTAVKNRTPFAGPLVLNTQAFLFMFAICLSAVWNAYAHGYSEEIKFHWAFLVFWFIDRELIKELDWNKLFFFTIIASIPSIIRSFAWLCQPDEIAWAFKVGFSTYPRAFGFNANTITYSEGLIALIAWIFAYITFNENKQKKRFLLLVVLSALLIITFSRVRSGWLAFLIISFVHGVTYAPHRKVVLGFFCLLIGGFFIALMIFGFNFESILERQELLLRGINLFLEHPILGIGPDRFDFYPPISSGLTSHPHNTIVGIASETGVIGLAFFLLFTLSLMRRSYQLFRAYRGRKTPLAWVTRALFYVNISFWVFGLSDYNFGSTEVLLLHILHWAVIVRIPMPDEEAAKKGDSRLLKTKSVLSQSNTDSSGMLGI